MELVVVEETGLEVWVGKLVQPLVELVTGYSVEAETELDFEVVVVAVETVYSTEAAEPGLEALLDLTSVSECELEACTEAEKEAEAGLDAVAVTGVVPEHASEAEGDAGVEPENTVGGELADGPGGMSGAEVGGVPDPKSAAEFVLVVSGYEMGHNL